MKLGNTDFDVEAVKGMTFDEFEANYKGLLQGHDLKDAWLLIAGDAPVILPKKKKGGKVSEPNEVTGKI
jgi:hypothetical protein